MPGTCEMPIIVSMTARSRSPKILLVADRRSDSDASGTATIVRRYRLARVRLAARPAGAQARYEHPKRLDG